MCPPSRQWNQCNMIITVTGLSSFQNIQVKIIKSNTCDFTQTFSTLKTAFNFKNYNKWKNKSYKKNKWQSYVEILKSIGIQVLSPKVKY